MSPARSGWAASAPEAGFLFPAFDDRRTNLYNVLYYTRSAKDNRPELIEALFHIAPPQPAEHQREAFGALLGAALEDECDLNVMQSVQNDLRQRIEVPLQQGLALHLEQRLRGQIGQRAHALAATGGQHHGLGAAGGHRGGGHQDIQKSAKPGLLILS